MERRPKGVRDRFPGEWTQLTRLTRTLMDIFDRWNYSAVRTPIYEHLDTFQVNGEGNGFIKWVDEGGEMLVLRPDLTQPAARIAAGRWRHENRPLRLAYSGPVYRRQPSPSGHGGGHQVVRETFQTGVERIGSASISGDVEVISLLMELLNSLGLEGYQVHIGHPALLSALLSHAGIEAAEAQSIRADLERRDLVAVEQRLTDADAAQLADVLLPYRWNASGVEKTLNQVKQLTGRQGAEAVEQLTALCEMVRRLHGWDHLRLNVGLVRQPDYYQGCVFDVVVDGVGVPIAGGGRYETRWTSTEDGEAAVGFALYLDELLRVQASQGLIAEDSLRDPSPAAPDVLVIFDSASVVQAWEEAAERRQRGERVALLHQSETDRAEQPNHPETDGRQTLEPADALELAERWRAGRLLMFQSGDRVLDQTRAPVKDGDRVLNGGGIH